ncbi:MAG: anhydro-N-acetylmuramic acid kinase [Janthinobacterium lividum]
MLRAIGLMSGTSLDGVDAAVIDTDGERVADLGPRLTLPYPPALRTTLRTLIDRAAHDALPADDPDLLAATEALTLRHAEAVAALATPCDLLGFHGQTILHRPERRLTWQIGDAALLARTTATPVAWNFRTADVAAGGQGAPLVPLFHAALARDLPGPLAVLNLGGVANLTYLGPATDGEREILACDTGPGNAALDDWALRHTGRPIDHDGALARAGTVDERTLATLLNHQFFSRKPPKSLDRQDFANPLHDTTLSAADGAATLTAFTAHAVAATLLPAEPTRWLVCGGGRHNPALMAALRHALRGPVEPVEVLGWDGDALEAQCFGFLAARVLRGLPLSLPGTTGVPEPWLGGRIEGSKPGLCPDPPGASRPWTGST